MDIQNLITSALTVCLSSLVSYLVSRMKIKNEIQKIFLQSNREDLLTTRKAFADAITQLQQYNDFPCGNTQSEALNATVFLSAYAPPECQDVLKKITNALQNRCEDEIKPLTNELYTRFLSHIERTGKDAKYKKH